MKMILITNNPYVINNIILKKGEMIFKENISLDDVLTEARDYIHSGWKLLTHPLTGSIKPNETKYKSIILAYLGDSTLDLFSLEKIENSLSLVKNMNKMNYNIKYPKNVDLDFQLIDFSLIKSGLESITQFSGN